MVVHDKPYLKIFSPNVLTMINADPLVNTSLAEVTQSSCKYDVAYTPNENIPTGTKNFCFQ